MHRLHYTDKGSDLGEREGADGDRERLTYKTDHWLDNASDDVSGDDIEEVEEESKEGEEKIHEEEEDCKKFYSSSSEEVVIYEKPKKWLKIRPYFIPTERDKVCELKWRPIYRCFLVKI